MRYKLKYSSLLFLEKKKSILYIKGPLGRNVIKVPSNISFFLDNSRQIIIFYPKTCRNKKKVHLSGFLSIFSNSCRILVFGELVGLNLSGLGLKFLKIKNFLNKNNLGFLYINLGYSDTVKYIIDFNHSIFFLKDNRNILCYSSDFSYIRNKIFNLLGLKKPDRYKQKGLSLINKII